MSVSRNKCCNCSRCSGVAWRHFGPTAIRVILRKSTAGIIFSSTKASTAFFSPCCSLGSFLIASKISLETLRTNSSGDCVLGAEAAGNATQVSAKHPTMAIKARRNIGFSPLIFVILVFKLVFNQHQRRVAVPDEILTILQIGFTHCNIGIQCCL